MRSQASHNPTAEQVAALTEWTRRLLGDRFDVEDFGLKISGYCASYPLDWLEGAFLIAKANAPPNQFDRYANGTLCRWFAAGKPSYEDIDAAKRKNGRLEPAVPALPVLKPPPDWKPY